MENSYLKLQSLSAEEIICIIKKTRKKTELPYRLFPKYYKNAVDIIGNTNRSFFYYLETIVPELRLDTIDKLFQFCYELRCNQNLLNLILSIECKTYPLQKSIRKFNVRINKRDEIEDVSDMKAEVEKYEKLSNIIENGYKIHGADWIFLEIGSFMKNHIDSFTTEQLLWSFCIEYFEEEDLKSLSSIIMKTNAIEFDYKVQNQFKFPYRYPIPINEEVLVDVDGTEFTDCVEVSTLHFLYITQPTDVNLIMNYWDSIETPFKEKIKSFFLFQGPKRSNNETPAVRKMWAEIVSKIPGIIYKKKTDQYLELNNVEIKAAWCNYLKVLAHIKNNKKVWNDLCKVQEMITKNKKISQQMIEITCSCFSKLAGEKLLSIEWIKKDIFEGVRDMEDGTLDLLGRIRCTFVDAPKKIDFIMLDGHGFVEWMDD